MGDRLQGRVVVDRDPVSADDTVAMIRAEGGEAIAHTADIRVATACVTIPIAAMSSFGALDVLHNNVGIGGCRATTNAITLTRDSA